MHVFASAASSSHVLASASSAHVAARAASMVMTDAPLLLRSLDGTTTALPQLSSALRALGEEAADVSDVAIESEVLQPGSHSGVLRCSAANGDCRRLFLKKVTADHAPMAQRPWSDRRRTLAYARTEARFYQEFAADASYAARLARMGVRLPRLGLSDIRMDQLLGDAAVGRRVYLADSFAGIPDQNNYLTAGIANKRHFSGSERLRILREGCYRVGVNHPRVRQWADDLWVDANPSQPATAGWLAHLSNDVAMLHGVACGDRAEAREAEAAISAYYDAARERSNCVLIPIEDAAPLLGMFCFAFIILTALVWCHLYDRHFPSLVARPMCAQLLETSEVQQK